MPTLWILHKSFSISASLLADQHLEEALNDAVRILLGASARLGFMNGTALTDCDKFNPHVLWVAGSRDHFTWTLNYALSIAKEMRFRGEYLDSNYVKTLDTIYKCMVVNASFMPTDVSEADWMYSSLMKDIDPKLLLEYVKTVSTNASDDSRFGICYIDEVRSNQQILTAPNATDAELIQREVDVIRVWQVTYGRILVRNEAADVDTIESYRNAYAHIAKFNTAFTWFGSSYPTNNFMEAACARVSPDVPRMRLRPPLANLKATERPNTLILSS